MDILTLVFIRNHDVSLPTPTLYTCTQDQGCLPGLVIFLDNDDPRVVSTSLEVTKVGVNAVNATLVVLSILTLFDTKVT